jgi:HEPN domain-containing protein
MARKPHAGVTEQRKANLHRMEDAQVLFDGSRWRGAMYLAGYAVECRLKYKLMRRWKCFNLEELEATLAGKGIAETAFTHNLGRLIRAAGGWDRLRANGAMWTEFGEANEWQPAWRYNPDMASREVAQTLLDAAQRLIDWIENNL